ncbi:MAG: hypothetical protein PETM_01135 [Petrimonas sp.]|uniref:RagB/SusD family nutrient uptake outer membrane protein n=1 Tax=Petrimonas sp. TaxID=2023866 RepID=UPI0030CA5DAF
MKKLKYYIYLVLFSALLLTACEEDILDDNPYYMGDSADQIFTNAEKIAAANMGLYDALQNAEFLGGRAQIYVDARGLDVNPPTFFGLMSTFSNTASDATTTNAWQGAYRTVGECNAFLEGIERAKSDNVITDDEYKAYAADAKFIRGVVYFYALNFWGQMYVKETENLGIPLILRSFDGGSAFTEAPEVKRASIEDSYKQIIEDFAYAETNLPATRDDVYEGRATATSGAANAMLSRVYLYMKNYDKVIEYADKVTGYELDAKTLLSTNDPANSSEVIFSVAMNSNDNPNTNNALGQHYGYNRRADISVSQAYLALLSDEDARKTECLFFDSSKNSWYCNKYRKTSSDWAPIIRYAEVLLNKAEALMKKPGATSADKEEAITILNQIHKRSNPDKTYTSADFANNLALVEEILLERRRELAFEGHSSFDLFRNEKGIPAGRGAATATAIDYPSNYFALPIPSYDVEKSKGNLVQNKGY